jgi:hypothetical protein
VATSAASASPSPVVLYNAAFFEPDGKVEVGDTAAGNIGATIGVTFTVIDCATVPEIP